ncbi:uncharacterized protein LOC62_02G002483 [Vanrija pseudolonga]|uniref:Uncharacterized protein n=1 Tax=Vanrija pseudolonga TaxID=143232 RepID=A0AAF1BIN5_9TREE|nr:hypothetical protein LOC62_02G002483 [Vanrija pseudolonga]
MSIKSQHDNITLCMKGVGVRPQGTRTCSAVEARKRRYSQELFSYTLSMWDSDRSQIERRSATHALNQLNLPTSCEFSSSAPSSP